MLNIQAKINKLQKELRSRKVTKANRARLAAKVLKLIQLETELEKMAEEKNRNNQIFSSGAELKAGDTVFRYKGKERLTGILVVFKNKLAVQLESREIVPFYGAWQNEERNVAILSAQKQAVKNYNSNKNESTFKAVQISLNL